MKSRFGYVEEIPCVQGAVADEFERISMKVVRPRTRGSADNPSRRSTVLCRIIAGENCELLDGVRTQTDAQGASRRTICVIIDADAIQPGVVLPRSTARDCHLVAEPPLSLANCLRSGACNSWLKRGQVGRRTTVKRQVRYAFGIHHSADRRTSSFGLAGLVCRSTLHNEVYGLVDARLNRDRRLRVRVAGDRSCDLVCSWPQVSDRKRPVWVGGDLLDGA